MANKNNKINTVINERKFVTSSQYLAKARA